LVIADPERFGLPRLQIETAYALAGEPLGVEGQAREALLRQVLGGGWIRIREHVNRQWTVEFAHGQPETLARVRAWARYLLRRGLARDPHLPVHLTGLEDGYTWQTLLRQLPRHPQLSGLGTGSRLRWPRT